jgi:hypothetical protein
MATFFVMAPSYFAQIANGVLLLVFLYILLSNYSSFLKTDYVTKLQIIGALAIALGVHGSLHLGLEQVYDYNPLFIFA